jgi:hypothetical protein
VHFYSFAIISPWRKAIPFIWTNLKALSPRMICAKFGWNWSSGSGEEVENVKSLQTDRRTDRRTDRQTDDGQTAIRIAHLSFQLRWVKKRYKTFALMTWLKKISWKTFYRYFLLFVLQLSWVKTYPHADAKQRKTKKWPYWRKK